VTGTPDTPSKAGNSIADISAGMYAYSSILAALLQRGRTGRGAHIDVALLETMVEWMSFPLYYAFENQSPPGRTGAAHATIYPYGPFRAGDGKRVMFGLQNEREWAAFCDKVLQQPQLVTDGRFASNALRVGARAELDEVIHRAFANLTAPEVVARLDAAGIANARINEIAEVWEHPQLAARRRWTTVGTPNGEIPALKPPAGLDGVEPRMDPVPALGEHTKAVLGELGYTAASIAELREARAI
jgi:itaconate CoA-transferase